MGTYVIADTHFGDEQNTEMLAERPANSYQEMEETLVENWNRVVDEGDTVYVVGDMFGYDVSVEYADAMVDRLNGEPTLIKGNHDNGATLTQLDIEIVGRTRIDQGTHNFYLVHAPADIPGNHRGPSIHGHNHSDPFLDPSSRRFNVAADRTGYEPVPLGELADLLETYDDSIYAVEENREDAGEPEYAELAPL